MLRIEPLLDIKMVRTLLDTKDLSSREELEKKADSDRGIRLLEIMAAISDGARILPVMAQLLRHPNSRVRSKAALLVGRSNKNFQWVEQRMAEPDARVRANALESLWDVDSGGARQVLWNATSDADNRVAGNALHGLYRLGEAACIPLLLTMLSHPQEDFRATAVWVAGETGDPRFLPALAGLLSDPESKIRSAVFRSIAKLKQSTARFSTGPQLRIHMGQPELLSEQWREMRVSVSGPNGPGEHVPLVGGLKPTQFVLHDGAALVTEYEAVEESHTESLCLAFALPRVVETNDALHRSLQDSFSCAIHHKRKSDAWLTLRYRCEEDHAQPAISRSTKSILAINEPNLEPEPLTLPPDLRFSTEPEAILSAVSSPGSRLSSAPNMVQAARILLSSIANSRGSRHVILVHHPVGGNPNPDELQELLRAARASKVTIHVIASALAPLETIPVLRELCARTGGLFVQQQELPRAFETLCANLINHYHIRFRALDLKNGDADPDLASVSLRIQVFSEQGSGEETFSLVV